MLPSLFLVLEAENSIVFFQNQNSISSQLHLKWSPWNLFMILWRMEKPFYTEKECRLPRMLVHLVRFLQSSQTAPGVITLGARVFQPLRDPRLHPLSEPWFGWYPIGNCVMGPRRWVSDLNPFENPKAALSCTPRPNVLDQNRFFRNKVFI